MEHIFYPKRRKVPIGVELKPRLHQDFYKISKKLHPKPRKVPFWVEPHSTQNPQKRHLGWSGGGLLKFYKGSSRRPRLRGRRERLKPHCLRQCLVLIRKPACGGRLKPHCLRQCLVSRRKPACGGRLKPHCLRQCLVLIRKPASGGRLKPHCLRQCFVFRRSRPWAAFSPARPFTEAPHRVKYLTNAHVLCSPGPRRALCDTNSVPCS